MFHCVVAQSRLDYTVYAGPNYSCISTLFFYNQPVYTGIEGPLFGLKYQIGGKLGYGFNDNWKVRLGVRFIERSSPKGDGYYPDTIFDSWHKCLGATSEIVFTPKNSKLSLVAGINYDLAITSNTSLPSLGEPHTAFKGLGSRTKYKNYFFLWSFGGEYRLTKSWAIGLHFERAFTPYSVKDTNDPFFFGVKNTVISRCPQGFEFNLNYTF